MDSQQDPASSASSGITARTGCHLRRSGAASKRAQAFRLSYLCKFRQRTFPQQPPRGSSLSVFTLLENIHSVLTAMQEATAVSVFPAVFAHLPTLVHHVNSKGHLICAGEGGGLDNPAGASPLINMVRISCGSFPRTKGLSFKVESLWGWWAGSLAGIP